MNMLNPVNWFASNQANTPKVPVSKNTGTLLGNTINATGNGVQRAGQFANDHSTATNAITALVGIGILGQLARNVDVRYTNGKYTNWYAKPIAKANDIASAQAQKVSEKFLGKSEKSNKTESQTVVPLFTKNVSKGYIYNSTSYPEATEGQIKAAYNNISK